ncbi:putative acyl-CoA oxidase [Daldinia vernicosa]|uniref:putative acyl-CoA oxidase n=1 Tax=Daldinia vernicosa TaxID=114800 RepID=UPI0020075C3E|nr:putative acyl-CoA oxidase [Daldinia vernicosa]KAI0844945.1 putative acyl-CoA oxidase [Daldinia vernicosa]
MAEYEQLLEQSIWDITRDHVTFPDPRQIKLSYERARTICRHSGMTVDDILNLRPRFWEFHRHFVTTKDYSVTTTLAIHWNLCIGTIAKFAHGRKDLQPLLQDLLSFNVCGEYLLTEIGHGLDARNLETTATLKPDGSFELHTPNKAAAKAMPPTTPWAGVPRVGVVFARLLSNDVDCGVKPFIVKLCDATQMCPGVISRPLPVRNGARALDHSITTFNHVQLPPGSLLGPAELASKPRIDFLTQIWRVSVGTLSLSLLNIPALRQSAFIAGTYSIRRHVGSNVGSVTVPIISFATQYRPVLAALVQASAFDAFADDAIKTFCDDSLALQVRHAVASCFKATVTLGTQTTLTELADRCGWQGLFAYNRIIESAQSLRGNSIAEGDYTVLCIRLVSEVLLGRYKLPESKMKDCRLAKHEAGVWREAQEMMTSLVVNGHRDDAYNTYILPRSRALVEATGHRMAYEAAFTGGKCTPEVLALFESICVMSDLSWYCEYEEVSRKVLLSEDARAAEALLPQLVTLLQETKAQPWTTAPILEEKKWDEFLRILPAFQHAARDLEKASL